MNEARDSASCGVANFQGKEYWILAGGGTSYSDRLWTIEVGENWEFVILLATYLPG